MIDRTDHLELLALIEGELDAKAADALRSRLANEPKALALVEKLRADRALLRSLPEPELPRDFLAQLEPVLARTMLVESTPRQPLQTRPGEYRRQFRKRTRRIRWSRLSLAAIVMFALIIGVWAVAYNVLRKPAANVNSNVMAMNAGPSAASDHSIVAATPDLTGTVHHYLPAPLPGDAGIASANSDREANHLPPSKPHTVPADFAIVIRSSDQSDAEKSLVSAVSTSANSVAVVRNFSFAEAQRLADDVRIARRESGEDRSPDATVSGTQMNQRIDRSALKTLAESVRQHFNATVSDAPRNSTGPSSAQLAGDESNAPSLEQQLDYSSRGATHTIAVPAAELNELLAQIATQPGQRSALCMLPKGDFMNEAAVPSTPAINLWLTDLPRVRREIDRLTHIEPNAIVLVPVIIEAAR